MYMLRALTLVTGFVFNAVMGLTLAALALYAWLAPDLPSQAEIDNTRLRQPLRIYSADGLLMGEFGGERREPLAFGDTPKLMIKAFLAAEDSRFFEHPGIDPRSLLRAALLLLDSGQRRQGGSTITMQLARNLYLGREKTFRRKLTELLIALRLEARLSKQRLFELYQNKIYFGHRAYGIVAAARTYYGKLVQDLSLAQMAMLAGLPQAPSTHNPLRDPQRAMQRRTRVLARMLALGYIDERQHNRATTMQDDARLHRPGLALDAPHAAEMARRQVLDRFGESSYGAGLQVITSVDAGLQKAANESLRESLLAYERRHAYRRARVHAPRGQTLSRALLDELLVSQAAIAGLRPAIVTSIGRHRAELYLGTGETAELASADVDWAGGKIAAGDLVWLRNGSLRLSQPPRVQGALLALDPVDGSIRAMVGGYEFERSQFNRVVDARRQPGSAFKPLVYAAALSRGWTPATLVHDSPVAIPDGSGRVWRPSNFDGRWLGPIRLREALAHSRNLAAVNLLQGVGLEYVRDYLVRFGFQSTELPSGLSLVLGSGAASPLKMATAYARFANGGYAVQPYLIKAIHDERGRVLFQARPMLAPAVADRQGHADQASATPGSGRSAERVLEPRLAWQMNSLLAEVIHSGTGRRAMSLGRGDLAGKTGTSNDVRDSWFCGYHPELVAVAWMGHDDFSPLGQRETGGRAALGMWTAFISRALEGRPEVSALEPPGLLHLWVNRYSGALAREHDPDAVAETVREEYELMLLGPGAPGNRHDAESAPDTTSAVQAVAPGTAPSMRSQDDSMGLPREQI